MAQNKCLFNHGIDTVIIRVSDIKEARKWYCDVLGLTPVWDDPVEDLVVFETGGMTSLTIWQSDQPIKVDKKTGSYPIFKTTEIEKAYQQLKDKGVNVDELVDETLLKYFFFYDGDGNILEACQVEQ
ncbi:VOC family protein [Danxiaibacter flavus]|uniref:VOC family protein n=1 Tax=Danxiaibacter flavus TaxID=3049108 RepID=A0ABV3ZB39_9BACT|nr:VOC family protein [Chitinophagaceae bacterium DXS]